MNLFRTNPWILLIIPFVFSQCKKDESTPTPPEPNYADSVKRDLWGYYNFNGDLSDKSGNNHNCVGYNGIQLTYDIWGNDASALNFNGINNYATIEDGKNFPDGDFTISFLAMPISTTGRIFQKTNISNAKGASFGIGFNQDAGSPTLVFNISKNENVCDAYTDLSNSTPLYITNALKPYAWYYVTCKFENDVQKVYYNGQLVASQDRSGLATVFCADAPFHLGIWWLNDLQSYSGKLDELRIYKRGLSEDEIKYLSRAALNE